MKIEVKYRQWGSSHHGEGDYPTWELCAEGINDLADITLQGKALDLVRDIARDLTARFGPGVVRS